MYVAEIGVKCHNCGIRFKSRQLPVVVDTGYRNSELRFYPDGPSRQFEQYAICTCPSCGLADWATAFVRTEDECVLDQPATSPHLQYRSAAIAAQQSGRDFHSIAMFFLYAAWCADDIGAVPQAREYRRLAIDSFRKSIVDGSCSREARSRIEYLIGELLRRSGDFTACDEHFKAIIASLPSRYAIMARKLMKLAGQGNQEAIDFSAN